MPSSPSDDPPLPSSIIILCGGWSFLVAVKAYLASDPSRSIDRGRGQEQCREDMAIAMDLPRPRHQLLL